MHVPAQNAIEQNAEKIRMGVAFKDIAFLLSISISCKLLFVSIEFDSF